MKDNNSWFMQFNMSAANPDASELERMTRFRNQELFCLLKEKSKVRVDGAFFVFLSLSSRL